MAKKEVKVDNLFLTQAMPKNLEEFRRKVEECLHFIEWNKREHDFEFMMEEWDYYLQAEIEMFEDVVKEHGIKRKAFKPMYKTMLETIHQTIDLISSDVANQKDSEEVIREYLKTVKAEEEKPSIDVDLILDNS